LTSKINLYFKIHFQFLNLRRLFSFWREFARKKNIFIENLKIYFSVVIPGMLNGPGRKAGQQPAREKTGPGRAVTKKKRPGCLRKNGPGWAGLSQKKTGRAGPYEKETGWAFERAARN